VRSFNDPVLTAQLGEVWGELRDSPSEKRKLITHWKAKLTPVYLTTGDKSNGRNVFNKTCSSCHVLYGYGDHTGLDLTGSGRNNLDFLLENIVDPSAVIRKEYVNFNLQTEDDQTVSGLLAAQDADSVTLLMANGERCSFPRAKVKSLQESRSSLMPERMSHEEYVAMQRRNVIELAKNILSGSIDVLDGSSQMLRLCGEIDLDFDDEDVRAFILVESETDHLPIGAEALNWSDEALARKEPDLRRARAWATDIVREHCANLVSRFGNV
jgi:putative heme-binding domain-containing protein